MKFIIYINNKEKEDHEYFENNFFYKFNCNYFAFYIDNTNRIETHLFTINNSPRFKIPFKKHHNID